MLMIPGTVVAIIVFVIIYMSCGGSSWSNDQLLGALFFVYVGSTALVWFILSYFMTKVN